MTIDEIMRSAPVIPVLVLDGDEDWAKLAATFVGAGLRVLEVTLRTARALDAIRQMRQVPDAIVGAGTVLNGKQLHDAAEAGAQFIVSPGLTEPLAKAVAHSGIPYLPGVATAADIMRGLDLGLDRFEILPRRILGRNFCTQSPVRAFREDALLSDRRYSPGQRCRMAVDRNRPVRWR